MTKNPIREYYKALQDGTEKAGHWVWLWYEHVIACLDDGTYQYSEKKTRKAIKFIENFCHHSEGRTDLLKLELWQKAIVATIFGVLDADGNRQFRECVIVMGRKNGKTLFAAAIIAYMSYLDGEYGAKIYCLAPKLEQANIVYDAFYQMVIQDDELSALSKKRRSDIYIAEYNTVIKPLAFNGKKSDGFNPHLFVADEIASWPGDAGLKQYEVMKSAMGARRQPLALSISTAGYINDGIYDELIKRCTAVLLGTSEEKRLCPVLYMIDDITKWDDIEELKKANPNLGVSISEEYLREEIAIAKGSLSKRTEFLVKYCNIKQNSSQAWLEYQTVDKASGPALRLEDFRDCYCVGGIDLSKTTDLTSCCVVIEKHGKLYAISKCWMPKNRVETATAEDGVPYEIMIKRGFLDTSGNNHVDYKDCFNWFRDLVGKYQILPLKVGYDRYCTQYLAEDMKKYGFHMDDVYQGTNLSPVIREFEGIIKDGDICIGDNELLKSHLLNSALKMDAESQKVRLVKVGNRTRIDATAALLDAMCVRQKWYSEIGEQLKNEG